MPSAIEVGVYLVVFLGACYTVMMLLYAQRRFLRGEIKDFINAIVAAATAFLLGSLLILLMNIYSNTVFYSTLLLAAGFAFLLTSVYFVKGAVKLHEVSKVFGFAEVEKELGSALMGKRVPLPKARKPAKKAPKRKASRAA
ncbi:MAG: hypothetical protein ISS93_02020 [Candidatus Aenigmarchaeota archaeon]|nr:hypothetical protein [Candidatus Aenigmarchaeota archaeon]